MVVLLFFWGVLVLGLFFFSFLDLGQNPPVLEGEVKPSGGRGGAGRRGSHRAQCKTPAMIFSSLELQLCFDVT